MDWMIGCVGLEGGMYWTSNGNDCWTVEEVLFSSEEVPSRGVLVVIK